MDTRVVGELTEMKCQMYLLENGFIISKPIIDNARYDLILDYKGHLFKIQIKTSRWMSKEHEGFVFNCKSQHSVAGGNKIMKYTPNEIDFFMTVFNNEFYLIPCLKPRGNMKLRLKPTSNNQDSKAFFAKDYIFLDVISKY